MLDLVGAVEHHSRELRWLYAAQVFRDVHPLTLSPDVHVYPGLVFVLGAALDRLGLVRHVQRELTSVERRQCAELVEQLGRMASKSQLPPGHEAAGHDMAVDLR